MVFAAALKLTIHNCTPSQVAGVCSWQQIILAGVAVQSVVHCCTDKGPTR